MRQNIFKGSPADRAGCLMLGDQIVNINGAWVDGTPAHVIDGMVRGRRGTEVSLRLWRNGVRPEWGGMSVHVTLVREVNMGVRRSAQVLS